VVPGGSAASRELSRSMSTGNWRGSKPMSTLGTAVEGDEAETDYRKAPPSKDRWGEFLYTLHGMLSELNYCFCQIFWLILSVSDLFLQTGQSVELIVHTSRTSLCTRSILQIGEGRGEGGV